MERVYLAFMGRSIWGTFNSAWASAVHYHFLPQKVYLVVNSCDKAKAELCRGMLGVLYDEFQNRADVQIVTVDDSDFVQLAKTIREDRQERDLERQRRGLRRDRGDQATRIGRCAVPIGRAPVEPCLLSLHPFDEERQPPLYADPLAVQHHHDLWQEVSPDAAHHH